MLEAWLVCPAVTRAAGSGLWVLSQEEGLRVPKPLTRGRRPLISWHPAEVTRDPRGSERVPTTGKGPLGYGALPSGPPNGVLRKCSSPPREPSWRLPHMATALPRSDRISLLLSRDEGELEQVSKADCFPGWSGHEGIPEVWDLPQACWLKRVMEEIFLCLP